MDNRYEEALKRAKQEYNTTENVERKQWLEEYFPELRKSKDEDIMKAIIDFFELQDDNTTYSLIPKKDILAWLEKQADKDKLIKELGEYKVKYTQEVLSQQLENECELKPTAWSKDDEAMFQNCTGAIWAADYYLYDDKKDMEAWLESLKNRVKPQVKEWSEDDEKRIDRICDFVWKNHKGDTDEIYQQEQDVKWLKSLKDRVQSKQEWSEEDDAYKLFAISAVEDYYDEENPLQKAIVDWLKSLKDRLSWKPSKEQMDALLGVMVESGFNYIDYNTLESLYNDLKKL